MVVVNFFTNRPYVMITVSADVLAPNGTKPLADKLTQCLLKRYKVSLKISLAINYTQYNISA